MSNHDKYGKLPMSSGIVPVMRFPLTCRICRLSISAISGGMDPVNALS